MSPPVPLLRGPGDLFIRDFCVGIRSASTEGCCEVCFREITLTEHTRNKQVHVEERVPEVPDSTLHLD